MYVSRTALPLVDAARHNDVKPKLGRELMILTHDDDDDVCMYACMHVCKYVWLEADHFKWSVIIDLVWNRCCSVGYVWHCHLFMLLDTTT